MPTTPKAFTTAALGLVLAMSSYFKGLERSARADGSRRIHQSVHAHTETVKRHPVEAAPDAAGLFIVFAPRSRSGWHSSANRFS
jgi:hypothetical protein